MTGNLLVVVVIFVWRLGERTASVCQCSHLGIFESHLFRKSHFDRINKFVEAHSYHFTPQDSIHDSITDTDDDSNLLLVDPDTLNCIVRTELNNGKTPGIDNVYNIILKKEVSADFYKLLA